VLEEKPAPQNFKFAKMNKAKINEGINTVLMLLLFPITRLWHAFDATKVSPWLDKNFYYPIEQYWFYEFLSENLIVIILTVVIVRLSKMRFWLQVASIVWLVYCLYDLACFFYNFNRSYDYVVAYSVSGLVAAIVWRYKTSVSKLKNRQYYLKSRIEKEAAYQ
jgi:hypothetical protein